MLIYERSGNNLDEGTAFMAKTINTTSQLASFLRGGLFHFPNSDAFLTYYPCSVELYETSNSSAIITSLLDQILNLYPDIPALGSPYDPVGANKTDRFYGPTNQYKRGASVQGDTIFQSGAYPTCVTKIQSLFIPYT